jgi:hypothetical protein
MGAVFEVFTNLVLVKERESGMCSYEGSLEGSSCEAVHSTFGAS